MLEAAAEALFIISFREWTECVNECVYLNKIYQEKLLEKIN